MHCKKNKMVGVLLGLLVVFALVSEKLPTMRKKTIVRGVQLCTEAEGYGVTLLYHDVQPASDAADAKEQLGIAIGNGKSLPQAYADAEQKLPGRAVYKLCDVMLLSDTEMLSDLQQVVDVVAENQKGWLAAKLLYSDGPMIAEDTEDVSQIYTRLQRACEDAPYLYQANQPLLLLPNVVEEDSLVEGAAVVEQGQGSQMLPEGETQLFQSILQGYGRLELDIEEQRVRVNVMVSRRNENNRLVRDVYLFPVETDEPLDKTQLLQRVQQLWQTIQPIDQRSLQHGQGDARYLYLRDGKKQSYPLSAWEDAVNFIWMGE